MTNRIIIDYDPVVISVVDALQRVVQVVAKGKISESAGVKHYCWATTFVDGIWVDTRRKKKGQKSDSFVVRKQGRRANDE